MFKDIFIFRSRKVRMISLGCRVGVPSCLHKAKQLFTNWMQNNGPKPHVEIRNVVYYHGSFSLSLFFQLIKLTVVIKHKQLRVVFTLLSSGQV